MFKELYNKTIKLAGHKSSKLILGIISFIESFIFPIPPDVMIIPMVISKKNDFIKIFELYGVDNTSFLKEKFSSEGGVIAWMTLLAIAGFTPVPFKLLTITSGFVGFNIFYFLIVSAITRGTRFFLISFLIGKFGSAMKEIIEKKLIKVSIVISIIIIVVAFLVYKFLKGFIVI